MIGFMVIQFVGAITFFFLLIEPQIATLEENDNQELVNDLRTLVENGRALNEFDFMIKTGAKPADILFYLSLIYYLGPIFAVIVFVSGLRSAIKAQYEIKDMKQQIELTNSNLEIMRGHIDQSIRQSNRSLSQIDTIMDNVSIIRSTLEYRKVDFVPYENDK